MKNKDRVRIEVYGGTNPNSELNQSGKQATLELASYEDLVKELKKSFGNSVAIKYIDADVTGIQNDKCRQLVEAGKPFPITVINGEPRIVGGIHIELVRRFLDERAFQMLEKLNSQNKKRGRTDEA